MKKTMAIVLLLTIIFSFSLSACAKNDHGSNKGDSFGSSSYDGSVAKSSTDGVTPVDQGPDIYDEEDLSEISSKILVVSDVHVSSQDANTRTHLKNTLIYAKNNGINAVIFNGDTPNLSRAEDYAALDGVFTDTYVTPKSAGLPELIFNMGNHEFYPTENCAHEETVYDREVGKFKSFAEKWGSVIEDNVFVRDVNGIKCVLAFPRADRTYYQAKTNKYAKAGDLVYMAATGGYSDNDVQKVKAEFDKILASGYEKSIIFCTHHPLGQTYGSVLYGMEQQAERSYKAMLKNYPMVVHLAGHTHFSSLHERSFSQNNYTSIQIGMHTYGKYVSGVDVDVNKKSIVYDNITGKQYNSTDKAAKDYHGKTNFGMLLSFTEKKMIAERVYLETGKIYEHGKWYVPFGINSGNYHRKFYYENGERVGEELHFGEDTRLSATVENGKLIEITFNDADEFWACEGYEIVVCDAEGNKKQSFKWASLFWVGLDEKQTYFIPVSELYDIDVEDGYTVSVRALNFFGRYSESVTETIDLSEPE